MIHVVSIFTSRHLIHDWVLFVVMVVVIELSFLWGWFSAKRKFQSVLKKNKPPVTGEYGKVNCPVCKKNVPLTKAGNLYRHRAGGVESDYCPGTGRSLDWIVQQMKLGMISVGGTRGKGNK